MTQKETIDGLKALLYEMSDNLDSMHPNLSLRDLKKLDKAGDLLHRAMLLVYDT